MEATEEAMEKAVMDTADEALVIVMALDMAPAMVNMTTATARRTSVMARRTTAMAKRITATARKTLATALVTLAMACKASVTTACKDLVVTA